MPRKQQHCGNDALVARSPPPPHAVARRVPAAGRHAAHSARGRRQNQLPPHTRVAPFESSLSARYEVFLTDGGPGDLDGVANGSCDASIRLCRAETPRCEEMTLSAGRVRASGGSTRDAADAAEATVAHSLEALVSTGDACSVARVSLAAEEDASTLFRFRNVASPTSDSPRPPPVGSPSAVARRPLTRRPSRRPLHQSSRRLSAPLEPRCGETDSSTTPRNNATEQTPRRARPPASAS